MQGTALRLLSGPVARLLVRLGPSSERQSGLGTATRGVVTYAAYHWPGWGWTSIATGAAILPS